jgi:WD40 repeat protein
MPTVAHCPDRETLERLLAQGQPAEEIERLARHIEECPRCGELLDKLLQDNRTTQSLRSSSGLTAGDSAELSGLMARLQQLRPVRSDETLAASSTNVPGSLAGSLPEADATEAGTEFLGPAQQADEIGRLGQYRVLKKLGAGGMGMVFLAEDTLLRRKVALKTLLPAIAARPESRERFFREARAAAAIEHQHIVAIHQVGEDRGVPFLAMPFLKGESLEDRLRRQGKLNPLEAARIAVEMAEGLAAAHEPGLIHRDVKPANVWLEGERGQVKLLDFGLARAHADETHLTQSGAIVGTPAFMAPEQARGEKVDHRADLFSLGCVLYVMLTGRRPFTGESAMSILTALALDTPPAPQVVNFEVPAALSDFTMQLLAKKPEERPASAKETAAELRRIVRGLAASRTEATLPARQAPTPQPARPKQRRRVAVLAGVLLAGMILAAGIVIIIRDKTGKKVGEVNVPEGGKVEIVEHGDRKGNPAPQASPFDSFRRADIPDYELLVAGRGDPQQAPAELVAVLGDSRLKHWAQALCVAFRSDGKQLVSGAYRGQVTFWDPATGRMTRTVQLPNHTFALAYSPDGTQLAVGMYGTGARLLNPATGSTIRSFPAETCTEVLFTAEGKRLLTASGNNKVQLWDVATGNEVRAFEGHTDGVDCLALSKDEKVLVSGSRDGTARVWDLATGKELRRLKGVSKWVSSIAFTGDGKRVLVWQRDHRLGLWDPATGEQVLALDSKPGPDWALVTVAASPDAKWLVTTVDEGRPGITWWDAATGKKAHTAALPDWIIKCAFSPNSELLATADGAGCVRLWDTATGRERPPIPGARGPVSALAVSADGGRIGAGFGGEAREAVVWDVGQARPIFHKPIRATSALCPDGQRLALGELLPSGMPRLWELSRNPEQFPEVQNGGHTPLAFNRDGTRLASGYGAPVKIWDPKRGAEVLSFGNHSQEVTALAWSSSSNRIASASALTSEIKVWDPDSGKEVVQLQDPPQRPLNPAISPDGTRLAVANGLEGALWDVTSGKKLLPLSAWTCAFSPDSKTLAVAGMERTLALRDSTTGKVSQQWELPGLATSLTYALDGRHLLVGNGNGTVYVLRLAPPP